MKVLDVFSCLPAKEISIIQIWIKSEGIFARGNTILMGN